MNHPSPDNVPPDSPSMQSDREIPSRPQALHVIPEQIPDPLITLDQWLIWKYFYKADLGYWDKPPLDANKSGNAAKSTDSKTWATFEKALNSYRFGNYDGIGLALTQKNGITGFDLDDCRDPQTGEIAPWARAIVEQVHTYWEISTSGTGLRGFGYGRKPGSRCRSGDFEMYTHGRYLCITGHHLEGSPPTIESVQDAIDAVYAQMFPAREHQGSTNGTSPHADDAVIVEALRHYKNGVKFRRLFDDGDISEYGGDHSVGDLALCRLIAFRTQDPDQIDRLFRCSALSRQKWASRADYREGTIARAITHAKDRYQGVSAKAEDPAKEERNSQAANSSQQAKSNGNAPPPGPNRGDDHQRDDSPGGRWIRHGKQIISCQHNALVWLTTHAYGPRIALDTFRQSITIDGKPITDESLIEIVRQMEASRMIHWVEAHVRSAVISIGSRRAFSSLTRWLDSLAWDGKKRLRTFFADAYGAEATEYTEACADVLFKSAVARAYQPGCQADVVVVLIGPQGIGKSKGIAELVPDPTWYTDDLGGDLYDRKGAEGLLAKWLIEFSEFARINRATLDVVKAFLSRRVDHYRPAYGRMARDFPRQCTFIGTTNNPLPLQDLENRRFMPVHCPKDLIDIASQRDQLWAEAVHRYKAGEPWWVSDKDLLKTVREKQDEARQHDEWEEELRTSLRLIDKVTLTEAADRLGIPVDRLDKGVQTRLGLAMKAIGFTRKRERVGSLRQYYWERDAKGGDSGQ
jgi:Virulence-associated protein E